MNTINYLQRAFPVRMLVLCPRSCCQEFRGYFACYRGATTAHSLSYGRAEQRRERAKETEIIRKNFWDKALVLCNINSYRQFRALLPLSFVLRRSRSYGYAPSLGLGQGQNDSGILQSNLCYKALVASAVRVWPTSPQNGRKKIPGPPVTGLVPVLIGLLVCLSVAVRAQRSFLDVLTQYETWDNHAVAPTPDRGFLIGNNLKFPPEGQERHGFYLSKYDSCGLIEWARAYSNPESALYFSDLKELPNGNAIAMGQTGFDDLFLMRIDPTGAVLNMYTFDTSGGDQNYTLDVLGDKIMVFGNYYADNSARNYLLVVNENGQVDWARSYHRRLGPGGAIYCEDGSFLCVNGNLIYKIDEGGQVEWSQQLTTHAVASANLSKPVESGDGYVIALRQPDRGSQLLIKLNRSGQLQWESDQIPSGFLASSLDRLPNGHLIMANAQPEVSEGVDGGAPMLVEFSPLGDVLHQYGFDLTGFGRFTAPVCRAGPDGAVTIKGSFYEQGSYDYIIRLKPGEDLSCAGYNYEEVITERAVIDFQSANTAATNLNFSSSDTATVEITELSFNPEHFCEKTIEFGAMDFWDRLQCVDTLTWRSPLENATYRWDDGAMTADRTLKAPGQYQVKATTCRTEFDISIELEQGLCPCTYYIPNAFSPNGDGVNDIFQAYATCAFTSYQLQIFNRWGELLHQTTNPDAGWDGRIRGRLAEQGMYMYALKYSWEIQPGVVQDKIQTGSVAVVR